jgi:uncharacterized cupredoxin-like copper-binding protein
MRKRNALVAGGAATAVLTAGLAAGLAVAASGSAGSAGGTVPSPAGRMTQAAAQWVTGGTSAPGWMRGGALSMPAEAVRIAGLTDPAISVPAGAHVTIELINTDPDMAHGLVITPAGADRSAMPMMTAAPAFGGSALWFLGEPIAVGLHAGTLTFTATTQGSYEYLCPVPGHARDGMAGAFTVR